MPHHATAGTPKRVLFCVLLALVVSGCSASALSQRPGPASNASRAAVFRKSAPQTISMTHVLDFEDIGQTGHRPDVEWSAIGPYLTADEPDNNEQSVEASSAGEYVGWYTNAAIQHADGPLYTRDETTFAHDCSNNRISSVYKGQVIYLMDPHSPRLLRLWVKQAVSTTQSGYHIDYVDADSADDLRKFTARPCNNGTHTGFDDGDWTHATAKMYASFEQQTGLPILANALYTPSPNGGGHRVAPGIGLAPYVWGESTEECYSDTSGSGVNPGPTDTEWLAEETAEIAIMATGKAWFCSGDYENGTNASAAIPERIYQLASFLLTYQPAQAYLKQPWLTGSNFRQNKETHFVALDPIVPQPSDISALLTASGVYAREYGACYISGALAGPCAVVVNSSKSSALPLGFTNYEHTLAVTGTDPFDGGTVRTNGPPAPAIMPPTSAYILFP